MQKFQCKPAEVEAFQFNAATDLLNNSVPYRQDEGGPGVTQIWVQASRQWCFIDRGDYVIREPDGRGFYPCKKDIFRARWEESGTLDPTSP